MWVARLPSALVRAHIVMMPRLEAEEAMATVNATVVASGGAEPAEARAFSQALSLAAAGGELAAAPSQRRDPSELRQRGFMVRRVPKANQVILTDGA